MQDAWSNQSITHYMVSYFLQKLRVMILQSNANIFDSTFCTIIYPGLQNNTGALLSGLLKGWKRHIIKQEEHASVTRNTGVE